MESKKSEVKSAITSHTKKVLSVCFSPDQTQLCSAGGDKKVILTNLQNNQTEKVFTGHRATICGSIFSCNGEFLATVSDDKIVRIWKASGSESGNSTKLEGHSESVKCVQYIRKGFDHVISGSNDKTIKIWSVERKKDISTLYGSESTVFGVDILPDQRTLVSGDQKIRLWDLRSGKCFQVLDHHQSIVNSVHFHPNSFSFASGSWDKTIKIFDFRNFQVLQNYQEHSHWVYSVCFHPSGKYLLSGSSDKTVKVYDLLEKKVLFTLNDHTKGVRSVKFSPDGKFFASASSDKEVFLWNFNFGESCFENTSTSVYAREMEKKLLELNEEVKLMKIEHEKMILDLRKNYEKEMKDLHQKNEDLERKNAENENKILDLGKNVLDQQRNSSVLRGKNRNLKNRFDRHLDHFHRNKYKIIHTTYSPPKKMIQKKERRICFLNDSFRFQIDFEVLSGPGQSSPINFSTVLQISLNEIVIPNSEIQISPKSVSFDLSFTKLGENEIKIIFENVVKVMSVFVENSSLSDSETELLLFRGELEPSLPNTQQEEFRSSDLIQVCLSFVNENKTPLRFEQVKDYEFTVMLARKGDTKGLRGKYLSREFRISVEKEEDLVKISGGRLSGRELFIVCTIGEDEKLGSGEYFVGVVGFVLTKNVVFSIL